jgi:septal ring factor EnvC (AmiA/AmiB activator)
VRSAARRTAITAGLLALSVAALAQQADRERTEALARRAGERLQSLQQEAERLASDERTLLGDLRTLEVDREIKAEELRQVAGKGAAAAQQLVDVKDQVERLERDDVAERPELRARVVELYKLGQARYLRLLLSMSDARSVGQASRLVAALAKRDRDRVGAHQRTLGELNVSRTTLEARGKELAGLRLDAERARAAADRAVVARNQLIQNIDNERDLNAQLAGELQAAQQKLQLTLRQIEAGTAVTEPATLPFRPFRGDLDWPVAGALRQGFGRQSATGSGPSNGIEITADEGARVQAVHDGTVAFAGPFAGYGNLVIVQHDAESFSLYGDLSNVAVARGARVERAQTVGAVGTPSTGPPGLYFELRVDGRPVDPLQWLKNR